MASRLPLSIAAVVLAAEGGRRHGKFEPHGDAEEQWWRECARLTADLSPLKEAA